MIFLGIDYGQIRTGLAISDPFGNVVFPIATLSLTSFPSRKALLDAIAQTASAKYAEAAVLGLPLLESGKDSLTTRQVRNVAKRLARRLRIPMYFMPEFLSSQDAERELRQQGIKGKKLEAVLDQVAACRILESFLALPQEEWRQI